MYSFYGGQKGQDFKITRIFSNRAIDMVGDLKARWTSPVNVGDYVFINYGDPSYMNEETSSYNINLQIDLKDSGKSYTNSLWQKIYVDKNLTVSPDFPQNDNNIYIFLNLDEDNKEEYGESLHEVSDLESEECFGFGYRLIACVTGVTPRIQVFHQTIDIEDGDPYVTLDLTNPDTPKIKFYLQRGQRIEDVYRNIVGSQEEPNAYLYTDGRSYTDKNGETKIATLTKPQLVFDLPKAPTFYYGMLFGTGPLNFYHNFGTLSSRDYYLNNDTYKVYKKEIQLITRISDFLHRFLLNDTVTYTLDENSKDKDTGIYSNLQFNDTNHFHYVVSNKFFKEGSKLNNSFIYIQEEDQNVIFNPLSNEDIEITRSKEKEILKLYIELKNDYHLSVRPYERYKEDGSKEIIPQYMWTNNDAIEEVNTYLLSASIFKSFPNSLYPLGVIINDLIEKLFSIIVEDEKGNPSIKESYTASDVFYSFETYNIADYLIGVLAQGSYLNEHYYDVSKAYKADFYINEPTGKFYILTNVNEIYIEGKYIGAITAPAPIATTQITSSFYFDKKEQKYIRNQNKVISSLTEGMGENIYQEEFLFKLVNDPITLTKIKQVANEADFTIGEPIPQNENEQLVNIEAPMPIHIFTPGDSGLSVLNNKVIWDSTNYNGPLFSKGDLFFNITRLEDNNANRGDVYRYNQLPTNTIEEQKAILKDTMTNSWELVGNIKGIPGIPNPTKIVNITLIPTTNQSDNFKITYLGSSNTSTFNYKINKSPDTLMTIIQNIINGKDISISNNELTLPDLLVNTNNGEILLINYFASEDATPESYWGIHTNNSWNVMSFSGRGSSFLDDQPNKLTEQHKQQGYSVNYLETKFLEDHLVWNDWDPLPIKIKVYNTEVMYNNKFYYTDFEMFPGETIQVKAEGRNYATTGAYCKIYYNGELVVDGHEPQSSYIIRYYSFTPTTDISITNRVSTPPDYSSGRPRYAYDVIYITTK